MNVKPHPKDEPLPTTRRPTLAAARLFGACAATAVFAAALAGPAAAGHGSVSYENPKKIADEKKREQDGASEKPAKAPAPAAPAATAPAATAPAAPQGGDRDRVYATTARRELSELATISEEQIAYGKDAQLATLARRTLENVRKQMAELDQWLAAHPEPPAVR
jgi:hypothetical protein